MKKLFTMILLCIVIFIACEEEDFEPPTVESILPTHGATNVSVSTTISVTFNESMDASTVQANYEDTQPSGTVQVSSDDFTTVVRMAGGQASDENKTYTFTPIMDLDTNTTYKIKITTGVEDVAGNSMENQYSGSFTTE